MLRFKRMWYNHPINKSVQTPCIAPKDMTNLEGKFIKKGLPVFHNQCAIRMGVSLQRAGVDPAKISGCAICGAHPKAAMHFINASQLAEALARARIDGLGRVEKITGKETRDYYRKLYGRTGIIHIRDYWSRSTDNPGSPTGDHIDLWNGYRPTSKWLLEWFSWLGYYSNYAHARQIWFWPVD